MLQPGETMKRAKQQASHALSQHSKQIRRRWGPAYDGISPITRRAGYFGWRWKAIIPEKDLPARQFSNIQERAQRKAAVRHPRLPTGYGRLLGRSWKYFDVLVSLSNKTLYCARDIAKLWIVDRHIHTDDFKDALRRATTALMRYPSLIQEKWGDLDCDGYTGERKRGYYGWRWKSILPQGTTEPEDWLAIQITAAREHYGVEAVNSFLCRVSSLQDLTPYHSDQVYRSWAKANSEKPQMSIVARAWMTSIQHRWFEVVSDGGHDGQPAFFGWRWKGVLPVVEDNSLLVSP